ncbi:hypothetical protein ACOQFV_27220 [Nocardiopsis changdeensis]|uniref:Uncharacterized protein n=1 Tax=Nocardiopsis changdeensis TaxID=2831969 RepID=A0ABX8BMN6_9ACTN|nr:MULTISPECIES: hypothetical protein [Nocardiopsis]QUX22960.1 hypothetical protein KGD84_00680 [Nocardiopsis changdeensis]QYX38903.1 hypothetical protein K1J57_10130 [Nocardiopsis sp. MT53]
MDIRLGALLGEISAALADIPADAPASYIGARDRALVRALDLVVDEGADPEIVLPELMAALEAASTPPLAALERGVTDDALRALLGHD